MKKEKTRGIFQLIIGILALSAVLAHFTFDNISTDKSPYTSLVLIVMGLSSIYLGYQELKK